MLKKCAIILAFLIFSTFVVFSNLIFLGETVYAVDSKKSSGVITKTISMPFNNYAGVYKRYGASYDYSHFLKENRAKLIFIEEVDGVKNYYYYSKKLPYKEIIKNQKVNIQIAVSNDLIVISSPIIYGSY